MRRLRYLLPLLLVGYLLTGVAKVEPEERAVVRRFGRVVAKPGPGLWVGLPWGIDRVDREKVSSIRQLALGSASDESAEGQLLTGDQNLIQYRLVVGYALDESELENFVIHKDRVEPILRSEAETLAAEWAGRRGVDAVLAGRAALAQWLRESLPGKLKGQRLGIVVQSVSVELLAAPEEVRDSFEAVNQAQTAIRTRRNQANQEAERQLSDANTYRQRLQSESGAYKDEKEKAAKADATTFLARWGQYKRVGASNPDWLAALWREEIGKLLTDVKTRGRIELLDDYLGPNGIELHQFLPNKKR